MSGSAKQLLVVVIFFVAFFGFTIAEAAWVNRRSAFGFGRSFFLAFSSNILCVTVGFSVTFIIIGVILAMAWDGSLEQVPAGGFSIWAAIITSVLFPVVLLAIAKRVLLKILKLDAQIPNWPYSVIATLLFFFTVIGSTALLGVFF